MKFKVGDIFRNKYSNALLSVTSIKEDYYKSVYLLDPYDLEVVVYYNLKEFQDMFVLATDEEIQNELSYILYESLVENYKENL